VLKRVVHIATTRLSTAKTNNRPVMPSTDQYQPVVQKCSSTGAYWSALDRFNLRPKWTFTVTIPWAGNKPHKRLNES
jgi:hypothetical protein